MYKKQSKQVGISNFGMPLGLKLDTPTTGKKQQSLDTLDFAALPFFVVGLPVLVSLLRLTIILTITGRMLLFWAVFFGLLKVLDVYLFLEALPNHFAAEKAQQREGDPMVVGRDFVGE